MWWGLEGGGGGGGGGGVPEASSKYYGAVLAPGQGATREQLEQQGNWPA